jgi:hypothetical protein
MKKRFKRFAAVAGMSILLFGTALALLTSCGSDPGVDASERIQINGSSGIRVVMFKGHEYLAYDMDRGGSLCHSESCPCKTK